MMQKNNNEAKFWTEIIQAKSDDKNQQAHTLAETIKKFVKDGSIGLDLSDETYDSTVEELKRSIRHKKLITTLSISAGALIVFVVMVVFILIKGGVMGNPFVPATSTPTITPTLLPTATPTSTPEPTSTPTPTPEPRSIYEQALDPSEPVVPVLYDLSWVIPADQMDCTLETRSCISRVDPNNALLNAGSYALFYKNDTEIDKSMNLAFTFTDKNGASITPTLGSGTAFLAEADTNQNSSKFSNKQSWIFVGEYMLNEPTTFNIAFTETEVKNPADTLASNTVILVRLTPDQAALLANLSGKGVVYTIQDDALFTAESTVTIIEDPVCWLGKCSSIQKAYYSGVGLIGAGKYHLVIYDPLMNITEAPASIDYYVGDNASSLGKLILTPIEGLPEGWYQSESFSVMIAGKVWFKTSTGDSTVDTVTDVLFVVADAQ